MIKDSSQSGFAEVSKASDGAFEAEKSFAKLVRILEDMDVAIINYQPTGDTEEGWAVMIESTVEAESGLKRPPRPWADTQNKAWKATFFGGQGKVAQQMTDEHIRFDLTGFFLPDHEIATVPPEMLGAHLLHYKSLADHFPFAALFRRLRQSNETTDSKRMLPSALWEYVVHYARFTQHQKTTKADAATLPYWFSEMLDYDNLYNKLPSEQLVLLLLYYCEGAAIEADQQWQHRHMVDRSGEEVRSFFDTFAAEIAVLFGTDAAATIPEEAAVSEAAVKKAFVDLCLRDYDSLLIQEVLDDTSKLGLASSLPLILQLRYGVRSLHNMRDVVKELLFGMDRPLASMIGQRAEAVPSVWSRHLVLYPPDVQYWFEVLPAVRQQIRDHLSANLAYPLTVKTTQVVETRCQRRWQGLLQLMSAPLLVWEVEKDRLYPQWNILADSKAKLYCKTHEQNRKKRISGLKLLEQHEAIIAHFDNLEAVNKYMASNYPIFYSKIFHLKWADLVTNKIARLKQREAFYASRMREFGIIEAKLSERAKRLLLEEMILIEEEVKPYITFVKKAFQSALPTRKTVSFSPYRHASDGVEFDADTLYDHEKWIRADVMKVMESTVVLGEATQINTFCLDYSGSMNHERMRNLFKMVYLLVLGLEDRMSFDAFHFFGNNFISVVDFSEAYTNRTVLFRIMKQITRITQNRVVFSGREGTNISEGVGRSYKKMQAFIRDYRETNADANIASSMFVITDGEPSLGITDIAMLNDFIEDLRRQGNVEIKGIFIKSEEDVSVDNMKAIFGVDHFIETDAFEEGVNRFVKIMTDTYKKQRKSYKWKQRRKKLGLTD